MFPAPIATITLRTGRLVDINPLLYGQARACLVSTADRFSYDDVW